MKMNKCSRILHEIEILKNELYIAYNKSVESLSDPKIVQVSKQIDMKLYELDKLRQCRKR